MAWSYQILETLYLLHLFYHIEGACPGQAWKKMDIAIDHVKNSVAKSEVGSIKQCSEQCIESSKCGSFGVNIANMTCFLYENLVWSGEEVDSGAPPLYYYWKHQNRCPENYTYDILSGVCYKFFSARKTWLEAKLLCDDEGGHHIVADTSEKIKHLQNILEKEQIDMVHVGATDYFHDKIWNWINGHQITNWAPGEPNNRTNEDCMSYSQVFQGFFDEFCLRYYPYICEIPVI